MVRSPIVVGRHAFQAVPRCVRERLGHGPVVLHLHRFLRGRCHHRSLCSCLRAVPAGLSTRGRSTGVNDRSTPTPPRPARPGTRRRDAGQPGRHGAGPVRGQQRPDDWPGDGGLAAGVVGDHRPSNQVDQPLSRTPLTRIWLPPRGSRDGLGGVPLDHGEHGAHDQLLRLQPGRAVQQQRVQPLQPSSQRPVVHHGLGEQRQAGAPAPGVGNDVGGQVVVASAAAQAAARAA
jgi:hypothetical protein